MDVFFFFSISSDWGLILAEVGYLFQAGVSLF